MSRIRVGLILTLAILLQTATSQIVSVALFAQAETSPLPDGDVLVQSSHLAYQGAFRVPSGTFGSSSFDYGGTAIAFNAARNSLFIVGHDWDQDVAEISVPAISTAPSVSGLATATVLHRFTDATEGRMGRVGGGTVKVGGLLAYGGSLYQTAYLFYDASASQTLSHFISGTNLAVQGDVRGPYKVGSLPAGFVSGYFGAIPSRWQAALGGPVLNGNCCLSIISRTSYGPAVSAIDPATIGAATAPATPLVYYPSSHPLLEPGAAGDGWSNTSTLFNGATEIRGVVFPEGTRSVLFFGRQGIGPFCYGEGAECADPTDSYKGTHAYPYRYYVWAYDANDLASVKAGQKQPWQVRPYAVWSLSFPFAKPNAHIQGATYDPATGRIFISQAFGDNERPLIHVFNVQLSPAPAPAPTPAPAPAPPPPTESPSAPQNVRMVVTGSALTISWLPPLTGAPERYLLEAGSAPGSSNLGVIPAAATLSSMFFPQVPYGRYYLRMRAIFGGAPGDSSTEQIVTVGGCGDMPAAPSAFGSQVIDNIVTLSWGLPSGVPEPSMFVMEAGSEPGLANLAILNLAAGSRSFTLAAPPGRYFVRMRGRNACGVSEATADIVINVAR